jgi:hypothetical protein
MSKLKPNAAIDEAHRIIDQCFECESRAEIESKPHNGMGPLARRIFLIWKREPKVQTALHAVGFRALWEAVDFDPMREDWCHVEAERIVIKYLAEREGK